VNAKPSSSFFKTFVLVLGMLSMLVVSWEYGKEDGVLARATAPAEGAAGAEAGRIPQESIRLRILADSDAPEDQVLKYRIRDAVIASMNGWATGPQTLEEARETVRARLPEIETMVEDMVRSSGFDYDVKVELGLVPFPTKVYGGELYPAGDYEAVRITLGRGLGQNWWCVLFPPLCFVDVAAGETPTSGASGVVAAKPEAGQAAAPAQPDVEYRFFLFELVADVAGAVQSWLA